jgi:uncharacterized protein (UPF0332 family)
LFDAHHWPDEVGHAAYLAGFQAAQAFLFETIGKVFKSHKGVQSEFSRLTKDDPGFTPDQRVFLSRTYSLKAIADYEVGIGSEVTPERAANALGAAQQFVAHVAALLPPNGLHSAPGRVRAEVLILPRRCSVQKPADRVETRRRLTAARKSGQALTRAQPLDPILAAE